MAKVLYIISTLERTGPVNILYNLLKYLDRTTHQPVILTLSPEGKRTRIQDFRDLGIEIVSMDAAHKALSYKTIAALKKKVKELNPDIIHTNGFRADMLAGFFLKKYKKVTSLQNYPYYDYPMTYGKLVGNAMAILTSLSLKRFQQPITCSNAVAGKMKKKGVPAIKVINNGIDLAYFQPPTPADRATAKKQLGVDRYELVFCFIGVLTDRKLPTIAIDAFKKMSGELAAKSCLLMIGDGDMRELCEQHARGAGNILFFGSVSDTKLYLNASEFYIATSKAEGLPTSVLESLALGVPVILSDIEPHKEILEFDPEAGLLAQVYSVEDTHRCIQKVLQKNKAVMDKASINIVQQHLNAKRMAQLYAGIYSSL